jgi:cysteine sulfinate desulfinase
VAALLNAPSAKDIVWTRGTTEAINMVAQSYLRPRLRPGDEIIVSEAEHHANLVPWLMVAEQTGARIVKLPIGADRLPDVALLPSLITPRSRLLAIGQMSNVTGGCPDLATAIRHAHDAGMVVMVDGAQGRCIFPPTFSGWISIFMRFPAISCTGQRELARCTAKAPCWMPCRRGSAAAK